ncbi:MAG TPA: cytochrome c [Longimicrobiales bacterium]|nr:cytochrome c [Longimicrobiales bacterium]
MRERIAIAITILAVGVLLALSLVFAVRQNPGHVPGLFGGAAQDEPAEPAIGTDVPPPGAQDSDSVAGQRVFRANTCERCHSVAGAGSPRYPLDGVGARRSRDELRAWTVGDDVVQDSISPSALRAKQRFRQLPAEEMRVLLAYMASLVES